MLRESFSYDIVTIVNIVASSLANMIYLRRDELLKKHEQILKSYKRNHQGALTTSDDDMMDEVENISHKSKKVAGNLNTHKTRLSELQKMMTLYSLNRS